uniref:Solute carrier family 22 member 13-like n=1 Tax=Stegastes partitus TaxID=144197 RepID=A0A3B5AVF5_9TELE
MSNFGQILKEIGEFGLFQKRLLFALCILNIYPAFDVISQVFASLSFPHHCNTDWILEPGPNLTQENQRNLTIPVNEDGRFESCEMFTPVNWTVEDIEKYGINTTTKYGKYWQHHASHCNATVFFSFFFSFYRFGRRFAILLSLFILFMFGVSTAFSPNIYVYMAIKFICGTSSIVIVMNTSVLAVEWSDPSKTALCTVVMINLTSFGQMLTAGTAYLIHNWRVLQLVLFSPLVIPLIAHYWFLPESARWLLTHGRKEEARKELQRAARINGRELPEDLLDKINMESTPEKRNMFDIFKIPYLRKYTLIMGFNWFAASLLFYGLTLNVGSFGTNIYLTQLIFALVEIPANICSLTLIQHFGRRICEACFLFFGGVACLVVLAVPNGILKTLNIFL